MIKVKLQVNHFSINFVMLILSAIFFLLLLFDCDKKYNERKQIIKKYW